MFLRATAAQLPHMLGEVLPLDAVALGAGRFGFTTRIPYGVVAAITAFNAPANLLSQKLAPALAMGNAVVAKPSPPGTEVSSDLCRRVQARGLAGRICSMSCPVGARRRIISSRIRWSRR